MPVIPFNLVGPKGETGPQGPQGVPGPTGPAGGVNTVNSLSGNVTLDTSLIPQGTNLYYPSADKTKLAGIAAGAEVNVQSDWNQTNSALDDFIKNKPSGNTNVSLTFLIDGGGTAITTGIKADLQVPFAGTILSWTLLADTTGNAVIDVWNGTYAAYPPTVSNKITGSAPPTISSASKATSSTLTGWTTSFLKDSIFRINVNSSTTITRVTLSLVITRVI